MAAIIYRKKTVQFVEETEVRSEASFLEWLNDAGEPIGRAYDGSFEESEAHVLDTWSEQLAMFPHLATFPALVQERGVVVQERLRDL